MKATLCIDDAVGEYRRLLLDANERPFRLETERWSERGKRARLDEVWWGRAQGRMAGRGWFVDLGLGQDGVLETKATITEGAMIPVRVKSEAWSDKGPTLSLADMSQSVARPDRPGRQSEAPDDWLFAGVDIVATLTGKQARQSIDHAVEEASAGGVDIAGGGRLTIDIARALTAIDVDSAGRQGAASPDLDFALNLAAADEAARQIALRGIGGLVVIDFVSMAAGQRRTAVVERFRMQLAERLGRTSKVLEISALGLCEASIARRARPLAAASPAEREALEALRLIESEPGGFWIEAKVSRQTGAWLDADLIGWKKALADRTGARLQFIVEDRPPGRPSVSSKSQ